MSIRFNIEVVCEKCGNYTMGVFGYTPHLIRKSRKVARLKGWKRYSGLDFCPECIKAYKEEANRANKNS